MAETTAQMTKGEKIALDYIVDNFYERFAQYTVELGYKRGADLDEFDEAEFSGDIVDKETVKDLINNLPRPTKLYMNDEYIYIYANHDLGDNEGAEQLISNCLPLHLGHIEASEAGLVVDLDPDNSEVARIDYQASSAEGLCSLLSITVMKMFAEGDSFYDVDDPLSIDFPDIK